MSTVEVTNSEGVNIGRVIQVAMILLIAAVAALSLCWVVQEMQTAFYMLSKVRAAAMWHQSLQHLVSMGTMVVFALTLIY